MTSSQLTVATKVTVPGYHYWGSASNFLRSVHRHLFIFTAEVRVGASDREIEFFDLQDVLRNNIAAAFPNLQNSTMGEPFSCEAMAEALALILKEQDFSMVRVVVSEDGESEGTWYAAPPTS